MWANMEPGLAVTLPMAGDTHAQLLTASNTTKTSKALFNHQGPHKVREHGRCSRPVRLVASPLPGVAGKQTQQNLESSTPICPQANRHLPLRVLDGMEMSDTLSECVQVVFLKIGSKLYSLYKTRKPA